MVNTGILVLAITLLGYGVCALLKQCLIINVMIKKSNNVNTFGSFLKNWKEIKRVRRSTITIYSVLCSVSIPWNQWQKSKKWLLDRTNLLTYVPKESSNILRLWDIDLGKYRINGLHLNFLICFSTTAL